LEDPKALLTAVHEAVRQIVADLHRPKDFEPVEDAATAWTTAVGMLRVRPARCLYYLNPPPGVVTDYLIAREAKELRIAKAVLLHAAETAPPERKALILHSAACIPDGKTDRHVLAKLLSDWQTHRFVFEELFTPASALAGALR